MARIRIREQAGGPGGSNAKVSFDDETEYPIAIRDPFSKEEEERLEWYFEEHLHFPFTDQVMAQVTAASITKYGETLFEQVFADREAYNRYKEALQGGLGALQLEIIGSPESPEFHALHWEALKDPNLREPLALQATMVRKNLVPQVVRATVRSSPTINVLVVTARPFGKQDVGYRTISRPLVENLRQTDVPVRVTILRPGTYQALDQHLQEVSGRDGVGYYHVIHFDVHGAVLTYNEFEQEQKPTRYLYNQRYGRGDLTRYEGHKAFLFLEGEQDDQADPVEASELANLLISHQVPIAILNACQSGKQVGASETSLGSRLMRAGVQLVLAMGYSVTVSAAELLMRTLYSQLFSGHELSIAICQGRRELYNRKGRRAYFNQTIDLEDWLLPVVYQNQPQRLTVREFTSEESKTYFEEQAARYGPPQPRYGFVGRDLDILQIEKRLLTKRTILLVRGMGGAGKTTLLQHLGNWWQITGLVNQVFYFGYDEKAWTRQQILHNIAQQLLGPVDYLRVFQPLSPEAQQAMLVKRLRAQRHLLLLDNLESITGAQLAIQHTLPAEEQQALRGLLADLVGGRTLVLLGSRSEERWLSRETFEDNVYDLGGLDPEAASTLAERILERYNVTRYRQEEAMQQLLKLLNGFPLALEVVLANLARQTPKEVLSALQAGDVSLDTGDSQKKTESILRCIDYSHSNLSPEAQQLLLCLAPFTSVLDTGVLEQYTARLKEQPVLAALPFERWQEVLQEATNWGLLSPDPNIPRFLRLQPTLLYFLRSRLYTPEQAEIRHAVEVAFREHYDQLGKALSDLLQSKEPQERQIGQILISLEYENLMHAMELALTSQGSIYSPYNALSLYLTNIQDPQRGLKLSQNVLSNLEAYPTEKRVGPFELEFVRVVDDLATGQLELKQYGVAELSFQKALTFLQESLGIDAKLVMYNSAGIYHRLGRVAEEQRHWDKAEQYYRQTLQLYDEFNDRHSQAMTYHQLGRVAEEQRHWDKAEQYYQQALQLYGEFNDRHSQAMTYHQLGNMAQEQRQFAQAEQYYQQALQIYEEYNDRYEQAGTYHHLGMVAQEQRKFPQAEQYYQQALQLKIEFNDRYGQASTYGQLGNMAQEQRQWQQAEQYYQQALQLYVEFNDRYRQTSTYHNLGMVAQKQRQWEQAEQYYQQALQLFIEFNDLHNQAKTSHQLGMLAQEQRQFAQAERYYQQALQLKNEFNYRYEQASTYHQLGNVAQEQRQWVQAEQYYQQALQIYIEFNDRYEQAGTYHQLGQVAEEQRQFAQAQQYYQQALQLKIEFNDRYAQADTYFHLGVVAEEQQQFAQAEQYYQQALQLDIEFNERYNQAKTYHQLGRVAQDQRQFAQAEQYYQQALQLKIEFNDRYSQASTYHQLGIAVQEQRQFAQAEQYYQQALQIYIEFDDRYEQAGTYYQLGTVAQKQRQFAQAEQYYQQALQIYIEFNDRYEQAGTYHQLGQVAEEQRHWDRAREHFLRALETYVAHKDEYKRDITLRSLARLWQASRDRDLPAAIGSIVGETPAVVEEMLRSLVEEEPGEARG